MLSVKMFCELSLWSELWLLLDDFNKYYFYSNAILWFSYYSYLFSIRDSLPMCCVSFDWSSRCASKLMLRFCWIIMIGCNRLSLRFIYVNAFTSTHVKDLFMFSCFYSLSLLPGDLVLSQVIYTVMISYFLQLMYVMYFLLLWVLDIKNNVWFSFIKIPYICI